MDGAAERLDFAPPAQPGALRGLLLALVAHALLVVALTFGLQWKRDSTELSASAELWSAVPQEAAPAPVPVPPPVVVAPPVVTPPVVKAPPLPEPPAQREADIAVEREREKQRLAEEKREAELERERDRKRKELAERRREEALEKQKLAAEKKRADEEKKRKLLAEQERQEKRLAQLREENLKRSLAQAGGGTANDRGVAAQSSGPSASWAGRVRARVKPNIVFTDDVVGNPEALVEVRLAPDGTIVGKRVKKSSGLKSWDDAVLRALDKTEVLPRDIDGRVPNAVDLAFRPKD